MPNSQPILPALPLIAYAEPLCKGARLLLVGDASSGLAHAAVARGARLVHVCDRDASRRAAAQAQSTDRSISFGAPEDGPASLREAFFDLVLIENLAAEPDPLAAMHNFARLMSARASALIAVPNSEAAHPLVTPGSSSSALDYYALYDAVAGALPFVRMLGQVPFVGYSLIDFAAEGEPSPVLDTSLMPTRGAEPDYFVAFGSREQKTLDQYAVVQLPGVAIRTQSAAPAAPVATPGPAPDLVQARAAELSEQLARQELWINELEGRAVTADERADAAESELDELREQLANREQHHATEHARLLKERENREAEPERLKRRVNDLDDQLTLKQTQLEQLQSAASETDDVSRLEQQLKERGERLRNLEAELSEAERTGRELVRRLAATTTSHGPPAAPVIERLAHAEAELATLRWSLEVLTGPQTPTRGNPVLPG